MTHSERNRRWRKTAKGVAARQRENASRRQRTLEFAKNNSVCCVCSAQIALPIKLSGGWTSRKCNQCKAITHAARKARYRKAALRRYHERKHIYAARMKAYKAANKAKIAVTAKEWWRRNREKFMNSERYAARQLARNGLSVRDIPNELRQVKLALIQLKREMRNENNERDSGNAV